MNRSEIKTHIMFSISSNNIVRISITEITRRLSALIVIFNRKSVFPTKMCMAFHGKYSFPHYASTSTAAVHNNCFCGVEPIIYVIENA